MNIEQNVLQRYADAAVEREAALCCPVSYDPQYLKAIPQEVLDRDYGCGDPSAFVREGETVLDLGSGGGKICFIASQVVGPTGQVLGVDFNPAMLDLARQNQPRVAAAIGYDNVTFLRGRIQDLTTNVDLVDSDLGETPIRSAEDYLAFVDRLRAASEAEPLVASDSVDVIVSNCVLNLVHPADKRALFAEMIRVL
ncbi:MAG: methyltransferase domain-containing protein, partial [Parvibaculum sp.]